MDYYIFNRETKKLELHFNKEDYLKLTEDMKKKIKSAFLFSRKENVWVSRAKFPNFWKAETVGIEKYGWMIHIVIIKLICVMIIKI